MPHGIPNSQCDRVGSWLGEGVRGGDAVQGLGRSVREGPRVVRYSDVVRRAGAVEGDDGVLIDSLVRTSVRHRIRGVVDGDGYRVRISVEIEICDGERNNKRPWIRE